MKRVRRMSKNFIPLSFSEPDLPQLEVIDKPIQKSTSEPLLLDMDPNIVIEFEGDGPLGIIFENIENDPFVKSIKTKTVASEEYKLKVGLKLIKIDNYDLSHTNYGDIMNLIRLKWIKFNKIELTLEELESESESESESEESEERYNENCPIYLFLQNHNCLEYYEKFISLGAKTLEDLNFIEYQDLVNMKMSTKERNKIYSAINFKINVYFSPYLTPEQLKIEKNNYDSKKCNFIEIHHMG